MSTEKDAGQQPVAKQSIKRRVIRLVLIPGAAAMVLWLVASGYLVFNGFYERAVAVGVRQVSIPAVTALVSIQRERRMSIAYVTRPTSDMRQLIEQRRLTDDQLATLRDTAEPILASAPGSIAVKWSALSDKLEGMPGIRSTIDSGSAGRQQVYDFYNGVLDAATALFDTQARAVRSAAATQGGIAATDAFEASDLMSRSGSIISGSLGAGTLSQADYLQFTAMVGAYRSELNKVSQNLEPRARELYGALLATPEWRSLVAAENTLLTEGPWRSGAPKALQLDEAGWERTSARVSDALTNLSVAQADATSLRTLHAGNNQLLIASLGSLAALIIAVIAIVWAVRQSQILVNSALSVRLSQLGKDAAAVVDDLLPEMMRKLRRRERVDRDTDLLSQDYGRDEIGQLAQVLNRSLHAAVGAAVDEANARAAGTAMLMGVARRPQRPLQRGLKVVEDLQERIGDEQLLANLFDINHQMAQTRRFLENLIILAGGQTGRRFHKPVPMRRVLLAATAETQQYQRVTLRQTADVAVVGSAVAGTIHLLAELVDNALTFSPPNSPVWISSTRVERGIVIEIEDGGVGMPADQLATVNELLATAPTPDVTALKDGAQIGLWVVAELARREGIQVTLRTSAYGGVLAVVLLPERAASPYGETPTISPYGETPTMEITGDVMKQGAPPMAHPAPPAVPQAAPRSAPPVPAPASVAVAAPLQQAPAGRPQLPVRRPQEHLNPLLREEEPSGAFAAPTAPTRTPDQARDRFARYQHGWRAGKHAATDPDQPPPPGS
ncbi:nitrate- and nitrite sensing domain-containing protein [Actinoplanes sp. NBRC 103695]|uniref:sensor histidine kinase n=1 Tax=Actinoplanes sp. NBRC 103695 TaxID=3032202 RepID=UPI0024A001C6|nr:nitrate- and nitrite sensing domain-containing protein [Actinoplanes sp. NBRC 103695]GLY96635.1 histidine kinase [Actinoplanes sp. NBRC 103695]